MWTNKNILFHGGKNAEKQTKSNYSVNPPEDILLYTTVLYKFSAFVVKYFYAFFKIQPPKNSQCLFVLSKFTVDIICSASKSSKKVDIVPWLLFIVSKYNTKQCTELDSAVSSF